MKKRSRTYLSVWQAAEAVAKALDGDVSGECYTASLAVYILAGREKSKLKLYSCDKPEEHYWLRGPHNEFIDLTAGQFRKLGEFYIGSKRGVFPKRMPNSATRLAQRARRILVNQLHG